MQRLKELLPNLMKKDLPPAREPTYSCKKCKDTGWGYAAVPPGDPLYGQAIPCECGLASRGRIERLRKWAGLPEGSEGLTFANFIIKGKDASIRKAYSAAFAYAKCQLPACWLTFTGGPGLGKTHLAVAILRYRLDTLDPQNPIGYGKYVYVPEMLDEFRATYGHGADSTLASTFAAYKDAPLLMLDDLGAERQTDWANEKLEQLLDWRYFREKDTVITLNYGFDRLTERMADRIMDTREGRGLVLVLSGQSHRRA